MPSLLRIITFVPALLCATILFFPNLSHAQMPEPTKEHGHLKMDVGTWKASVKSWVGPEGILETPEVSEGRETNTMIGEFWIVGDFEGMFGGMKFKGHSITGYDAEKKQFSGTWVDSFSTSATKMTGSYDEKTKTMTWEAVGMGPDGKPMTTKQVQVYENDDKRVVTMYNEMPGEKEMVKTMEIVYTRLVDPQFKRDQSK